MNAKLILAIALSAAATTALAQNRAPSKAQAAYVLCVFSSLNRVDDGKSDPSAIASATQYDCQSQWDAIIREEATALDSRTAQAFQTAVNQRRLELDTQLVLQFRRSMGGKAR